MNTNDLISASLGLGINDTAWLDEFCEDFDLDFGDEDIYEVLDQCRDNYSMFGNMLISNLCQKVADEAKERFGIEHGSDEADAFDEVFKYNVNASATSITFDGSGVYSSADLDAAIEAWQEENGIGDERNVSESKKVTLTIGQIRKLVKEAAYKARRMQTV